MARVVCSQQSTNFPGCSHIETARCSTACGDFVHFCFPFTFSRRKRRRYRIRREIVSIEGPDANGANAVSRNKIEMFDMILVAASPENFEVLDAPLDITPYLPNRLKGGDRLFGPEKMRFRARNISRVD